MIHHTSKEYSMVSAPDAPSMYMAVFCRPSSRLRARLTESMSDAESCTIDGSVAVTTTCDSEKKAFKGNGIRDHWV